MTRRDLIALLLTAAATPPAAAPAQRRTFLLGMLVNTRDAFADELVGALRDLGYVEGQNLTIEWRFAQGVAERWLPLAKELVALKVDAIVVPTTPAALAAKQATSTIPIVIPTAIDPVGAGLAESLARPGDNVTGFSIMSPEISGKALSLLKEAVPALRRVAVLWNAANPAFTPVWQSVDAVAGSLGLTLLSDTVRKPEDFPAAFAAIASQRPEAFFLLIDAFVGQHLGEIIEFASRERLPAASTFREFAAAGGLMSYGPNLAALQRQAASYVDRIFNGESPATLPFQQPTTFELVINLKAAKMLGLTVPHLLLAQADDVIE
jgi:putative tryptophan/tyrosine transport system substrate-binding protein